MTYTLFAFFAEKHNSRSPLRGPLGVAREKKIKFSLQSSTVAFLYFFMGRELCYLRIVGLRPEIYYEGNSLIVIIIFMATVSM